MSRKRPQRWKRVDVPHPWKPDPGDELIGEFIATEIRNGRYGEYKIHHIKTRGQVVYVSGFMANDLFAVVTAGALIKLVYLGPKQCATSDHCFKQYELFTAERS